MSITCLLLVYYLSITCLLLVCYLSITRMLVRISGRFSLDLANWVAVRNKFRTPSSTPRSLIVAAADMRTCQELPIDQTPDEPPCL
jgi:hypothetical protein